MYPNLLGPLLAVAGLFVLGLVLVVVRQPVARRLAARQVARRPLEAALVMSGSVLGTAIIVGALIVGDTLNFSVRQDAYRTLGPIDERVVSPNPQVGAAVAARLDTLRQSGRVDGLLSAQFTPAAASRDASGGTLAEPRVVAWDVSFADASHFGAPTPSGLTGTGPTGDAVVVNVPFARSLDLRPGDSFTLYLYGVPRRVRVARIVAETGLAGMGPASNVNRNVFVAPGALTAPAGSTAAPHVATLVSNRGGVEGGNELTSTVTERIRQLLTPVGGVTLIETPKRLVLRAAKTTGDALGALFLMIGSFSIIAGALLLVNIFVMLAEERKGQLGMLRAVGLRRSRLVGSFTLEGAGYAALAAIPGVALGIGIGWAVARVAAQIFRSFSADGSGLRIAFAMTPTSIINGVVFGLLIGWITVLVTSARISRFNIIAAIRDLPAVAAARNSRRTLVISSALAALFAVASVPAIGSSNPTGTFIYPALTAFFAMPALQRLVGKRAATTLAGVVVLAWTLLASVVRPAVYDTPSMSVFVILGALVAFSSVIVLSANQDVVLRPLHRLIERPTRGGLATRIGVAYPLAKPFRTGATLAMYTLITLVLVLLTEIGGTINKSIDRNVANTTAGYAVRLDFNPAAAQHVLGSLHTRIWREDVSAVTPLTVASGQASDPGHRTSEPVPAVVVGAPDEALSAMTFSQRLDGLATDAAVWAALARNPQYAVLDSFFGSTGGPNGRYYSPGDTFELRNPATGVSERKTIAGILNSGMIFYSASGSSSTYPLVLSDQAVRSLFPQAVVSTALVRLRPGVSADVLAPQLQGGFLADSVVATPIASTVRKMFSANIAFFRLMQGFLALGLLVGIAGLGVVMVRAVRERRRTIGVLRALGFQARTVRLAFLIESSFVAIEGVVLGCLLGVLTTWLMYQKSASFDGIREGFPIVWSNILLLALVTIIASLVATIGPARRAAALRPALAVRISD